MRWTVLFIGLLSSCSWGCSHGQGSAVPDDPYEEGIRTKGDTYSARIWVLIANGQFAEAEALITEGSASGVLAKNTAQRMLERIAVLNTKLGEIPATLQRARDFPSQLKDFTCFQIKNMLDAGDYSLASQAQLRMAVKLIEQQARLMGKLGK